MNKTDSIAQLKREIERESNTLLCMMFDRTFTQDEINEQYDLVARLKNGLKLLENEND
jgi:hypothetical protein